MSITEQHDDREGGELECLDGRFVKVPERIKKLKRDSSNMPIPWFVPIIEGAPDFTRRDADKIRDAIYFHLCYLCGQKLGSNKAFLVGPLCAISRESVEPPCHVECATFEAQACGDYREFGVALVWITHKFETHRIENKGQPDRLQFKMGEPDDMLWITHGREATADEIAEAVAKEIKPLMAEAEKLGPVRVAALQELEAGLLDIMPGQKKLNPHRKLNLEGA